MHIRDARHLVDCGEADTFYHECLSDFTFVNCAEDKGLKPWCSTQKWTLPRAQVTNFNSPARSPGERAQSGAFYGPDSQLVLLNKCTFSQTFYYLVNNQGELIKKSFLCAHQRNEEHARALARGEKVSSACCFYPAGGEKRKGLQFKGRSQGQTSKRRLGHWSCRAKTRL